MPKNLTGLVFFIGVICWCQIARAGEPLPMAFGFALEGLPEDPALFSELEGETGWPVNLVNVFLQWPSDPDDTLQGGFPEATARAVAEHGAMLVLTWEPMFIQDGEEHAILASDILSGRWDAYITRFALAAASCGGRCILRFGHEMNLSRYHWGLAADDYGPDAPGVYIAMFRHVREVLRSSGGDALAMAFCPNVESLPSPFFAPLAPWNTIEAYYPGDEYVDVVGLDGYNWGTSQTLAEHGWDSTWREFEDIFTQARQTLQHIAADKPLYIFETSCAPVGGSRVEWINRMLETAANWSVQGIIWFHANKEVDWRLPSGTR